MRRALTVLAALLGSLSISACFLGKYEVVRVYHGKPRTERFVSEEAYAASLEASIAEQSGDWSGAVAALRRARSEDPGAPDLGARLGLALCRLGEMDDATKTFADVLMQPEQRERAFTARGDCAQFRGEFAAARADYLRAIEADADATLPSVRLAELDVREGHFAEATVRLEEVVLRSPTSAHAWSVLAEARCKRGDLAGAVTAALAAGRLDDLEGKRARAAVLPIAESSAVIAYVFAMRALTPIEAPRPIDDPSCASLVTLLEKLAHHGTNEEIVSFSRTVRATCPIAESAAATLEIESTWTPARSEELEKLAAASSSTRVRMLGERLALRRRTVDELLGKGALPRVVDGDTLALDLSVSALRKLRASPKDEAALAMLAAARELAPIEPTVQRLAAEAARIVGRDKSDPWRLRACTLAATEVERAACAG